MGLLRPGPPTTIISEIRKEFDLRTFVEIGTYIGDTASQASQEFEKVITIEASENIYKVVRNEWETILVSF